MLAASTVRYAIRVWWWQNTSSEAEHQSGGEEARALIRADSLSSLDRSSYSPIPESSLGAGLESTLSTVLSVVTFVFVATALALGPLVFRGLFAAAGPAVGVLVPARRAVLEPFHSGRVVVTFTL